MPEINYKKLKRYLDELGTASDAKIAPVYLIRCYRWRKGILIIIASVALFILSGFLGMTTADLLLTFVGDT